MLAESNCTCPFEPTPACCPQHGVLATSHGLSVAQREAEATMEAEGLFNGRTVGA